MSAPEPALAAFLQEHGLADRGEQGQWSALAGGVSSDIWRVETRSHVLCVKRALARLKVAMEWTAPTSRNAYEWAYMRLAASLVPGCVATPLAYDGQRGLIAMAWLAPDSYRLWKTELLAGRADLDVAASVGDVLGRIHAATAGDANVSARFDSGTNFHALRIEPYLLATASIHPDLEGTLRRMAARTECTKKALVHGDVSPKNILIGAALPVLLDAECAWYGDPAFDLAFCLNHLVIKRRVVANGADCLDRSFDALVRAYLSRVDWEPAAAVEARAAGLLSALSLARVDGKSPVEYLDAGQRAALRQAARAALLAEPVNLREAHALLALN